MELEACCRHSSLEAKLDRAPKAGERFPRGKGPGSCSTEDERVATVKQILASCDGDTSAIDELVKTLGFVMDCKTAWVSLLTKDSTYICSGTGMLAEKVAAPVGVCHWALLPEFAQILICEDLQKDERMRHHWLASMQPPVRFYVAAPLVAANNQRIGTLCVLDKAMRKFSPGLAAMMINFAELVAREFEAALMLSRQSAPLLRSQDCYNQAFLFLDLATPNGCILHINHQAGRRLCKPNGCEHKPQSLDDLFVFQAGQTLEDFRHHIEEKEPFIIRNVHSKHGAESPTEGLMDLHFRPGAVDQLDDSAVPVGIPSGSTTEEALPTALKVFFVFLRPVGLTGRRPLAPPIKGLTVTYLLGTGAFSRVYRGFWLGKAVAVKVVKDMLIRAEGRPLEAALMTGLDHPNIVRLVKHQFVSRRRSDDAAAGKSDVLWLVLEFCDKGSLEEAIAKGWFYRDQNSLNGVDLHILVRTALQIATALDVLHARQILHCDLSKGNILLTSAQDSSLGFIVKVGDFGLSRKADCQVLLEQTELGTLIYKAPELGQGAPFSKATDVYAFGVLLWEMLMGQPAWSGLSEAQVLYAHSCRRQLPQLQAGLPSWCQRLVSRCLGSVDDRPGFGSIAAELQQQLEALEQNQ